MTSWFMGDDVVDNEWAVLGEALWGIQRGNPLGCGHPLCLMENLGAFGTAQSPRNDRNDGMTGQVIRTRKGIP